MNTRFLVVIAIALTLPLPRPGAAAPTGVQWTPDGLRLLVRSLSQPKKMPPEPAAMAPKKVMIPRIRTLSGPDIATILSGSRIVRNGT